MFICAKVVAQSLFHLSLQQRPPVHKIQLPGGEIFEASPLEKALIDSRFLVRLAQIKQLGLAYKVFPGGTHTRAEHSIGAAYYATLMFDSLMSKYQLILGLNEDELAHYRRQLRIEMLMHDTGHAPGSHLFERAARSNGIDFDHERQTDLNLQDPEFLRIMLKHDHMYLAKKDEQILRILRQLKDSVIDADKIDYLYRDAHHCGIDSRFDRMRLIDRLELTAVKGGTGIAIEDGGANAFVEFINMRQRMYDSLYYNDRVSIYEYHLERFLKEHFPWEKVKSFDRLDDTDLQIALRKNSKSIDGQAILKSAPYVCMMRVFDDPQYAHDKIYYQRLVKKFSKKNVIMFTTTVKGPKLDTEPFYVVKKGVLRNINILDMKPQLRDIGPLTYSRIYVNPDVQDEAQRLVLSFSRD